MTLVVVTPPARPLLDAATVRARLSLPVSVDDAGIDALVAAATGPLDGPDGWLGRALGRQTLELRCERFPWADLPIRLRCSPIVALESLSYSDPTGIDTPLDPTLYAFDGDTSVYPPYGHVWPATQSCRPNIVRLRYTAGYADGAVPPAILQAIVLQVAALAAMLRADVSLASETVPGVLSRSWSSADFSDIYDKAAARLLTPYRIFA